MKISLNWNWGTGIALVYSVFALSIILLVVYSFSKKIDLVTPDYYAKELKYQQQIDKINAAKNLPEAASWNVTPASIDVSFPAEFDATQISGEVTLFKPSNDLSDKTFKIIVNSKNIQSIPTSGLEKGMYKMKVDWKHGSNAYYQEAVIVLQ
jgi:hypothetical protein